MLAANNTMLNEAAQIIHKESNNPEFQLNDNFASKKRVLPVAPLKPPTEMNKSSSDMSLEKVAKEKKIDADKFKYSSLPHKKKDQKSKSQLLSTFYVDAEENNNIEKKVPNNIKYVPNTKDNFKRKESKISISPKKKDSVHSTKQTHVALYKFYARHKDELSFLDGDPVQVLKMYDDLWYEGINMTTGKQGIFPCRYVADILMEEAFSNDNENESDHRQFHLRFLGSVEVADYKGDEVLAFAIAKVVNQRSMLSTSNPPTCVLQLNSKGIRISDLCYNTEKQSNSTVIRKVKKGKQTEPNGSLMESEQSTSHFFSLKNVTFCGNHGKDRRYFGFITKHPDEHRYACHIFMAKHSTDLICKVVGECFKKFYDSYIECRAATEDIYQE